MTTIVVLPARLAPRDSARLTSPLRMLAAFMHALLQTLALDPAHDLVARVDRMSIRSLLMRCNDALQPDAAWTINWIYWASTLLAEKQTTAPLRGRLLGSNDKPLSRAPCVVESPTRRTSAEHDETRAIDKRGTARNAGRDPGGRRAS